jgi:isopentenyl phosphate kinase
MITTGQKPIRSKISELYSMTKKSSIIPVTFGDVVYMGSKKYSILSGDALMSIMAKILKPSRIVFATNVDGVYRDMQTKEVVSELKVSSNNAKRKNGSTASGDRSKKRSLDAGGNKHSIKFFDSVSGTADVTGGMQRKIREAFKIASLGMDVMLVNGLYPDRIVEALKGKDAPIGTLVKGRK